MILLLITLMLLSVSFILSKDKTIKALKIAWKKFTNILFALLQILAAVSLVLTFIPSERISDVLSNGSLYKGTLLASIFGSITMMPGFIAFPLCGILRQNQVPYMIISAFSTTLMMVGILTFPVEQKYFGTKVGLIRNGISFTIALLVALCTGLIFKEVLL